MAGLEFEGFHYQSEADDKSAASGSSRYIDYSTKVVDLLSDKMKAYNKTHGSSRVTLFQLKSVYREAAKNPNEKKTLGEWCLAKVNMFLRMKSGEAVYSNKPKQEKKEMTKLELDLNEASHRSSFDITETWVPSEEDMIQAAKDIEEKDLNFDFGSINNLYLDDYKRIELDWS